MATRVEIKGDRISLFRIMVGFLPLAFGYFLSVLFQSIDPLIADDLMTDLAIGKGTLGMLTAAFPLAFAVCLLPSGIAIDRFGSRAVQSCDDGCDGPRRIDIQRVHGILRPHDGPRAAWCGRRLGAPRGDEGDRHLVSA